MVFVNNRKHCIASEVTCVWASFDTNVELFGRARRKEFVWKATTGLKDREVKNKYKILLVLIMIGAHYDRDDDDDDADDDDDDDDNGDDETWDKGEVCECVP